MAGFSYFKKMEKRQKQKLLNELKEKMQKDNSLPLKSEANNLVFGDGNPDAEVMFIGEGPGFWEDKKGIPFVGNAGAFLNQLLYSIELPREKVFITNVVHYRPPENRDPLPEELRAFAPYLDEMIKIINPKVITTLGRFSMGKFLPGVAISAVHGKPKKLKWKDEELMVIPMYHPAAGLRNGEVKRRTQEDFKKIPEVLEEVNKMKAERPKKEVKQMSLV